MLGLVNPSNQKNTDTVCSPLVTSQFPFQEKKTKVDIHASLSKDQKDSEENIEENENQQEVEDETPTISFDELKVKIKAMPKFRPFHSTGN